MTYSVGDRVKVNKEYEKAATFDGHISHADAVLVGKIGTVTRMSVPFLYEVVIDDHNEEFPGLYYAEELDPA